MILESIIESVLFDFLISQKPKASEVNEAREAGGIRGLRKYMQGPDIRVYETDRTEGDITVHRMECDEGKSTDLDDVPPEDWLHNDGTKWNDNDTTITVRGEGGEQENILKSQYSSWRIVPSS